MLSRKYLIEFLLGTVAMSGIANANPCYEPKWQRFSDPSLGFSADVTIGVRQQYSMGNYFSLFVMGEERYRQDDSSYVRSGGRCSQFSFEIEEYTWSGSGVNNPKSTVQGLAARRKAGEGPNAKVFVDQEIQFQGLPAWELQTAWTSSNGAANRVRYLFVVADDRIYTFEWKWDDFEAPPEDAARIFSSIRFKNAPRDTTGRSRAMLEDVVRYYWLRTGTPQRNRMSATLRAIADPKRQQESRIVAAFGYPQEVSYQGMADSYRVFRITHNHAEVDWYIRDNGVEASAITWRKVRDL